MSDRMDEYDWRKDLDWLRPWTLGSSADQAKGRLATHIERLEVELDSLLAEHEAVKVWRYARMDNADVLPWAIEDAHDNAERVMHGE